MRWLEGDCWRNERVVAGEVSIACRKVWVLLGAARHAPTTVQFPSTHPPWLCVLRTVVYVFSTSGSSVKL